MSSLPLSAAASAPLCAADAPPSSLSERAAPLEFARVYAEHFDFVWRSLRHLGVPAEAMDDAVQDLWLVVHRRLHDFLGRSSITTWLFGIAMNLARSRRRRRDSATAHELLSEEIVSPAPDPERVLVGQDACKLVQQFLEGLPDQGRAIFVSALLENFTPAETAEAVGVDVGSVYKQVRALRRALARRLSQNQENR